MYYQDLNGIGIYRWSALEKIPVQILTLIISPRTEKAAGPKIWVERYLGLGLSAVQYRGHPTPRTTGEMIPTTLWVSQADDSPWMD